MTHTLRNGGLVVAAWLLTGGSGYAQETAPSVRPADPVNALLGLPASDAPAVTPKINDGEAYHRADDAAQDPAELRTTRILNDEIASRNQLAEDQERADQAAYELERASHQAAVDQATRDQLAYEESMRQWEADRQRAERERGRYAADLLACRAGDRARC